MKFVVLIKWSSQYCIMNLNGPRNEFVIFQGVLINKVYNFKVKYDPYMLQREYKYFPKMNTVCKKYVRVQPLFYL